KDYTGRIDKLTKQIKQNKARMKEHFVPLAAFIAVHFGLKSGLQKKRIMKKKLIPIEMLSLISQGSFSQDVGLSVKDNKEVRHLEQEDSFLELTLEIAGVKVDATNKVKLKEITRATDE